jgi:hypothetical protein
MNGTLEHPLQMTVSGLPAGATATFTPPALVIGSSPVPVTLTIELPIKSAQTQGTARIPAFAVACVALVGALRRRSGAVWLCLLLLAAMHLSGCGGGFKSLSGSNSGTTTVTAATYTAVVTATTTGVTGDPLVHSQSFTLVVTQ